MAIIFELSYQLFRRSGDQKEPSSTNANAENGSQALAAGRDINLNALNAVDQSKKIERVTVSSREEFKIGTIIVGNVSFPSGQSESKSHPSEELGLKIEHAPVNVFNHDGKSVSAVALLVKSLENRKIVELRANINFDHFYYQPERESVSQVGYELNALLFWDNDNSEVKEIELRPDTLKILFICELLKGETSDGEKIDMALMASDPVPTSIDFSKESIVYVDIRFQGKLEGEYEFRALHYKDVFYTKPKNQRILFLEQAEKAYTDIPKRLLSRSKDVIEYMERIAVKNGSSNK